jgi:hypothetical protein
MVSLKIPGNVPHVFTPIVVIGKFDIVAQFLPVAEIEAAAQGVHLVSGIIYVVLPLDPAAARRENICKHVAYRRPPAVTYVKRSGRVSAHELHLHLRTSFDFKLPVLLRIVQNLTDYVIPRRWFDKKIEKAGSRYFDFIEEIAGFIKVGCDFRGDLPGISLQMPGQTERNIRSVIAMLSSPGYFKFNVYFRLYVPIPFDCLQRGGYHGFEAVSYDPHARLKSFPDEFESGIYITNGRGFKFILKIVYPID